jgi:WhiB family redox-sensing transcriptional regulator
MSKRIFAGVLGGLVRNMDWAARANCRNMDIELFFPKTGQNIHPFVKEVCATCDVKLECLWYANETESVDGIFAGMSPKNREAWRSKNKIEVGMNYEAWKNKMESNLLNTAPEDWREI